MTKVTFNLGDEFKDCKLTFAKEIPVIKNDNPLNHIGIVNEVRKNDNGELIIDCNIIDEYLNQKHSHGISFQELNHKIDENGNHITTEAKIMAVSIIQNLKTERIKLD